MKQTQEAQFESRITYDRAGANVVLQADGTIAVSGTQTQVRQAIINLAAAVAAEKAANG